MKTLVVLGLLCTLLGSSAVAADHPVNSHERDVHPIYRQLAKTIRGNDIRSKSARAELSYAESLNRDAHGLERKRAKTVDGKDAEVVFIHAWGGIPGDDFSMALLLIDGRAVDWASCWTDTRSGAHELLLEDIDGDHVPDVAFRADKSSAREMTAREHTRRNDNRVWLAAYSITSQGLKPIFATQNRVHHARRALGKPGGPLAFRVTGLPGTLIESDLYECMVSVTNNSKAPIASSSVDFFPEFVECGGSGISTFGNDFPASVLPGQTVSATIMIHVEADQDVVTLSWGYPRK